MTDKKEKQVKTICEVLSNMQKTLKAPKNQYNSFGQYKYRSCEDILEGIKQVLPDGYSIKVSDEVVFIGDRFYIKATACLCDAQDKCITNTGYAREEKDKKGMDGAQVTGAASSYARKYALNGLFAIDDTKDADTDEARKQESKPAPKQAPKPEVKPLSGEEFLMIQNGLKNANTFDELKTDWGKFNASKSRMNKQHISTLTKAKDAKKAELDNKEMEGK